MHRNKFRLLVGVICLFAVGHLAWGSPSGLNNISTTDVAPEGVLVFQTWGNFANNTHSELYKGFKVGVLKGLEMGIDWKATGGTHGHPTFQIKYAFDVKQDVWKGVVGIANVSDNRSDQGEVFPYVGTSYDFKAARLHLGYAPQAHDHVAFGGIDKMVTLFDRNLQLKADALWMHERSDAVFSAGFLYELGRKGSADQAARDGLLGLLDTITKNVILEAWISSPTTGGPETFTVKLNYVIKFGSR